MARAGCRVVRAWGQSCMVVHRPMIGSEGRADCAWFQGWLCMGSGVVMHGVRVGLWGRAGCTWGQDQYVRPCKHAGMDIRTFHFL